MRGSSSIPCWEGDTPWSRDLVFAKDIRARRSLSLPSTEMDRPNIRLLTLIWALRRPPLPRYGVALPQNGGIVGPLKRFGAMFFEKSGVQTVLTG